MEKLMEYGISLASRSYIFFWKFNCAKSLTKSRTQERLYIGMKFIFFFFLFRKILFRPCSYYYYFLQFCFAIMFVCLTV